MSIEEHKFSDSDIDRATFESGVVDIHVKNKGQFDYIQFDRDDIIAMAKVAKLTKEEIA